MYHNGMNFHHKHRAAKMLDEGYTPSEVSRTLLVSLERIERFVDDEYINPTKTPEPKPKPKSGGYGGGYKE
jgi:hypothetical protein